jgi:hypothetical protein
MARFSTFFAAGALGLVLAACSGGAGFAPGRSLPIANPGANSELQTVSDVADLSFRRATVSEYARRSIDGFDAFGSSMRALAGENAAEAPATAAGACRDGVEFFAPDLKGDPNSTQTKEFYDAACTRLARDSVRRYAPAGANGERVRVTVSTYAAGRSVPLAVRTESSLFSNATLGRYGYPVVADGFVRTTRSRLAIGSVKSVVSAGEFVVAPSASNVTTYCMDWAGFDTAGIPSLGVTFGWQGETSASPTPVRSTNADGSVTWTAAQSGSSAQAPIGGLSLASGRASPTCPIGHPAYSLAGQASTDRYALPMTATFRSGRLTRLRVTGAALGGGETLRATTVESDGHVFVNGTIVNGRMQIATFHLDVFGDGTLTVTSSGAQYVVTDWDVAGT